jgi:hypothetical protein
MISHLQTLERLQEWVRQTQSAGVFWHAFVAKGRETPNLRLWVARVRAGLSEADLAARLGLEPEDYKRLERNGEPVPSEVMRKAATILGTPLAWLQCSSEGLQQADLFGNPLRPGTR